MAACNCGWRDDVAPAADDYDAAIERWDGHLPVGTNPTSQRQEMVFLTHLRGGEA